MKFKIPLAVTLIGLFVSCDPTDKKFILINKSKATVSYYFSSDSTDKTATQYYSEFFSITPENKKTEREFEYIVAGEKKNLSMMGSWETYLNKQFKNGRAFLYVIDSVSIGKDSSVIKNDNLIRKYEVSNNYMKAHKWQYEIQ